MGVQKWKFHLLKVLFLLLHDANSFGSILCTHLLWIFTLKDECNSEARIHLYMKKDEKDDSAEIGCLMQGYIPLQT